MSKDTGKPKKNNNEEEKVEEESTTKTSKKEETPVNTTKFIGFTRGKDSGPWTLFNQMLSTAESIEHKVKFLKGNCEVHIIEVDLPQ